MNYLYLLYSLIIIILIINIILILRQKHKINKLENEKERIELSYNEVRSLKHDLDNIIQGMYGYIELDDINGLKNMFSKLIKEQNRLTNYNKISAKNINNPCLYNLINSKFILMKDNNIDFVMDIDADLQNIKMDNFELNRILGILLDNAIESAKKTEDKIIRLYFKFDKLNNRNLITIENSYNNPVNIKEIFECNNTSKPNKLIHGLGLWKVKQIIKMHRNININTYQDKMFTQRLEIYN